MRIGTAVFSCFFIGCLTALVLAGYWQAPLVLLGAAILALVVVNA